ncbi:MAG: murein L,D-transpeptidase [Pusillimonas sp.]|nr:murein L,D-transpeptidase [Pusillimonas sp.]MBC41896.1 murein L,D-transpeptidase [Pusillimonas sp.]
MGAIVFAGALLLFNQKIALAQPAAANPYVEAGAVEQSTTMAPTPEWLDETGKPVDQVLDALETLTSARNQGLDPADYNAAALWAQFTRLSDGETPTVAEQRALNEQLTASLEKYLTDLRDGRVDPHAVHQKFKPRPQPAFNARTYIADALQQNRLRDALQEAQPQVPMYDALVNAMAHYRLLAQHPAWSAPLPMPAGKKLERGQTYPALDTLTSRLIALGDLSIDTQVPLEYNDTLQAGIRAFQVRHGLETDGIIGPATLRQLNVSPEQRLEQMALTLERLRWTPLQSHPRMIVVNVPEFVLRAYETDQQGNIDMKLRMKVIVGRALDTSTPVFDEDMRFIEFSPYWNVPPSIARGETIPRLKRDPAYFSRQGFEFVKSDGSVSTQLSDANLQAVVNGQARIRQRPGPVNALGDIKFIFPNNTHIFLHHTPAPQLFERSRRDFSHGCIRVEEPVALARFVLENDPAWPRERIEQAMQAGKSQTIRLNEPIPVVLAYGTVIVRDGQVYFYDDIYGHDATLSKALKNRR